MSHSIASRGVHADARGLLQTHSRALRAARNALWLEHANRAQCWGRCRVQDQIVVWLEGGV